MEFQSYRLDVMTSSECEVAFSVKNIQHTASAHALSYHQGATYHQGTRICANSRIIYYVQLSSQATSIISIHREVIETQPRDAAFSHKQKVAVIAIQIALSSQPFSPSQ